MFGGNLKRHPMTDSHSIRDTSVFGGWISARAKNPVYASIMNPAAFFAELISEILLNRRQAL
jgi:hypothetical protein